MDDFPIKTKTLYVKLLLLSDKRKYHDQPLFWKKNRASNDDIAIYDSAIFHETIQFVKQSPENFEIWFRSLEGIVDDVLLMYPFQTEFKYPDPSYGHDDKAFPIIVREPTDHIVVVAHHYNGFQYPSGQYTGVRADDNTSELRISVDFSSIILPPLVGRRAENNNLFIVDPVPFYKNLFDENVSEKVSFDYNNGRVFSIVQRNVKKGFLLGMEWQINWDNLATWQGRYEDDDVTPVADSGGENRVIQY